MIESGPPAGSFVEGTHTEYCEQCDEYVVVSTTVVQEHSNFDVSEFQYECGHTRQQPKATFTRGLVETLAEERPGDIEIRR